jgi:hypothetical protein
MRNMATTAKSELLAFLIFVFALSFENVTAQNAQTSKADTSRSDQWEYCVVSDFGHSQAKGSKPIGIAVITYFQKSRPSEKWVRAELDDKESSLTSAAYDRSVKTAIAMALSQLGEEGWELVGIFPYSNLNSNIVPQESDFGFYFKRRKPN